MISLTEPKNILQGLWEEKIMMLGTGVLSMQISSPLHSVETMASSPFSVLCIGLITFVAVTNLAHVKRLKLLLYSDKVCSCFPTACTEAISFATALQFGLQHCIPLR